MLIDTNSKSRGHVYIMADREGSYGECISARIGRSYDNELMAMKRADHYALTCKNVTVFRQTAKGSEFLYAPGV